MLPLEHVTRNKWTGTVYTVHLLAETTYASKTLRTLYMHTQYTHAWIHTNRYKVTVSQRYHCLHSKYTVYITAPFRYTSMNHNNILNYRH